MHLLQERTPGVGQEETTPTETTPTETTSLDEEIADIERQVEEALSIEDYDKAGTYVHTLLVLGGGHCEISIREPIIF